MAPSSADSLSVLRRNHRLPLVLESPSGGYRANREPAWQRVLTVGVAWRTPADCHEAAVRYSDRSWPDVDADVSVACVRFLVVATC